MSTENKNEITLRNGSIAQFTILKGRQVREAQKAADGDTSKIIPAMMAMCVTIDNKPIVMEDFDEMDGGDYLAIQAKFSELNF